MVQEEMIYVFYIYRSIERAVYPSESPVSEYIHMCVCMRVCVEEQTEGGTHGEHMEQIVTTDESG